MLKLGSIRLVLLAVFIMSFMVTAGNAGLPARAEGNQSSMVSVFDLPSMDASQVAQERTCEDYLWLAESYTSAYDQASGIAADETGLYVTGTTTAALPGQTHYGSSDAFVRKYSLTGVLLWTRQFGSASNDEGWSIAADETGIYVAGSTRGGFVNPLGGTSNAFVRKYDREGNELWTVQFGTSAGTYGRAVATDVTGVYLVGNARELLPGQSGLNGFYPHPFVRKYTKEGSEVWTRQFGTNLQDSGDYVALDGTGIYVAGYTQGAFQGYSASGNTDIFARKYSKNGDEIWTHQFGSDGQDLPYGLSVNGPRVYLAGTTASALPGQTFTHSYDGFITAYDLAGNQIWLDQFSSPTYTQSKGVLATESGALVGGITQQSLNDELVTGTYDAFVKHYDQDGNSIWVDQFGSQGSTVYSYGPGADSVDGFTTLGSRVFVLGNTSGLFNELPYIGGGNDHFIAEIKVDCGNSPEATPGGPYSTIEGTPVTLSEARASDVDADSLSYSWSIDSPLCSFSDPGMLNPDVTCADDGDYIATLTVSDGINYPISAETNINVGNAAPTVHSIQNNSVMSDGPIYAGTSATINVEASDPAGTNDPLAYEFDCDGDLAYEVGPVTVASVSCYFDSPGAYTVNVRVQDDASEEVLGSKSVIVIPSTAMLGGIIWARQYGGKYHPFENPTFAKSVSAGEMGIYVVGGVYNYLAGQQTYGGIDAYIRRYDAEGNEIWSRQFGTSMNDSASAVAVDSSGAYVVGIVDRSALPGQISFGESDVFIRKYSLDGSEIWTNQFGTNRSDYANGIALGESGVFMVGSTQGSLAAVDTDGSIDNDVFVRRYDKDGNEIWTRQFGTERRHDIAYDVTVDSSALYVVGITRDALAGQPYAGAADGFIRAYDMDGNELWTRQFGTASEEYIDGVAFDNTGVYIAGSTIGTLPGQASSGSADAFVRKYSPDGIELWTRQFGGSAADYAHDIGVNEQGVYIIGYTASTLPGQSNVGSSDAFMRKYTHEGQELWTYQLGTDQSDDAHGISLSSDIYLVGQTRGVFPGETNDGVTDAFVLRFNETFAPPVEPATTVTISPLPNSQGQYPDPVSVELSAQADTGLAIVNTFYMIDGGAQEVYAGPFPVTGDGQHTLEYWSVDNVGTSETHKTLQFIIQGLKIVTDSLLPNGTVGSPYAAQLAAVGGTPPYTWNVVTGALPPGLSLNTATGLISGTPLAAGTFGFAVQVEDASTIVTKQFSMAPPPPSGEAGESYSVPVVVIDPDPDSTSPPPICDNFEVVEGELPAGLLLDPATGIISGTPLDGGIYTFSVQCVVDLGQIATKEFTITISNPMPALSNISPVAKRAGSPAFVLALSGNNFVQSSIVRWNGIDRLTTYVSPTELQAEIKEADIASQGTAQVLVYNPDPMGGESNAVLFTIDPPNRPPAVTTSGPYEVEEGSSVTLIATGTDPDGDELTYAWDLDNDGTYETPGQSVIFSAAELDGPSSYPVSVQVIDPFGLSASELTAVVITNVNPVLGPITAPVDPLIVNSPVEVFASYTDAGVLDTHTATIDWGNGMTTVGFVDEADGSGTVTGSFTYPEPGVYVISIALEDDNGGEGTAAYQYVVVYDPNGSFVNGSGQINSPAGAYTLDPMLVGIAKFGFQAQYHKGASIPDGNTAFSLTISKREFEFNSTSYNWLVVAGAKAKFKGLGTIVGQPGHYKFLVSAIDGDTTGGDKIDKFRIKIWSEDPGGNEVVVYDNQLGADEDADPSTAILRGSISVHK